MRDHPLYQLTLVRFREFIREPEALFWVFGFPLLLAAGLGLAFRNTPAEVLTVGVVGTDLTAFDSASALAVEPFPTVDDGFRALREGKVALLVERPADGSVLYHYDDTNPEGRDARIGLPAADHEGERGGLIGVAVLAAARETHGEGDAGPLPHPTHDRINQEFHARPFYRPRADLSATSVPAPSSIPGSCG